MTRAVLFVCSNQTHVRTFAPVARQLVLPGHIPVRWIALDAYYRHNAALVLHENGWDFTLLPRPAGAAGTPWEGGPLARMRVLREGRGAVRAFLRAERPGVIVLGNDLGPLERLFIQKGRGVGIPSLLVQDGVIALQEQPTSRFSTPRRMGQIVMEALGLRMPDPKGYGQNGADRIAVMGQAVADSLKREGVPPERIAVTGQPRYDYLFAMRQGAAQPANLDSLDLPADQRIVLFSSQPYVRYNMCREAKAREIWRMVIGGVKGLGPGHHLVAKLHPAEDLEGIRRWLGKDFPPQWTLTRDADVLSLTFHADALVTVGSTTALEAIYLGKPVVILEAGLGPLSIPYVESGAALQARDAKELTARLREVLYEPSVRARLAAAGAAFVDEHAHAIDGSATARVAEQILSLLEQ